MNKKVSYTHQYLSRTETYFLPFILQRALRFCFSEVFSFRFHSFLFGFRPDSPVFFGRQMGVKCKNWELALVVTATTRWRDKQTFYFSYASTKRLLALNYSYCVLKVTRPITPELTLSLTIICWWSLVYCQTRENRPLMRSLSVSCHFIRTSRDAGF